MIYYKNDQQKQYFLEFFSSFLLSFQKSTVIDPVEITLSIPPLIFSSFDPFNIIKYLSYNDVLRLSQVCKEYRDVIDNSTLLWKHLFEPYEDKVKEQENIILEDFNVWLDDKTENNNSFPFILNELCKNLTPTADISDTGNTHGQKFKLTI